MNDIRMFFKNNAKNQYKLSIAYREGYNLYKYKFGGFELLFKEEEDGITLTYNKQTYTNFNEIQLILFDIFDYKNIEYIDVYLQFKIDKCKTSARIEDIYDDYYDDINKELICTRHIYITSDFSEQKEKIIKLKLVVIDESEYKLFYNNETIIGFEEILAKINLLF
jgi:hypothetical protein